MGGFRPGARSALAKRGAAAGGFSGAERNRAGSGSSADKPTVWQAWQATQSWQWEASEGREWCKPA